MYYLFLKVARYRTTTAFFLRTSTAKKYLTNLASPRPVNRPSLHTTQIAFPICFFFADADSLEVNGNPLVLLSAPVFLLILPEVEANNMHHNPMAAKPADPRA